LAWGTGRYPKRRLGSAAVGGQSTAATPVDSQTDPAVEIIKIDIRGNNIYGVEHVSGYNGR